MAANEAYTMTSHNLLNYSGLLFNKGNTKTPFSTTIGGKSRTTNHWTFPTSLAYTTGGGTSQPAITETDSLTAPNAEFITRAQVTNVCQIFQKKLSISYGKMSSMGQLSGLNIAGQQANPATELDFQVSNAMAAIANDIEFTFLNGAHQDGTYDDVAYKTRGITAAITTNTKAASGAGLGFWLIAELVQAVNDAFAPTDNLILTARPINIMQLNADATNNGLTVIPGAREENGIKLDVIITPFGSVALQPNPRIASGTAILYNPSICSPVYMPVPNKGNFFLEPLAKKGAADEFMMYGQCGLDYGAEWYHGKITGLGTSFTAPTYAHKIYVAGGTLTDVSLASGTAVAVSGNVGLVEGTTVTVTNTEAAPLHTSEVSAT